MELRIYKKTVQPSSIEGKVHYNSNDKKFYKCIDGKWARLSQEELKGELLKWK